VLQEVNVRANMLAQQASGYDVKKGKCKIKGEPGYSDVMAIRGADDGTAHNGESEKTDWRDELSKCISELGKVKDRKVRRQALKYVVINDVLYRQTLDGVLLKCLSEEEARIAMGEVHEGMCGTHQSAYKMRWVLRRAGVYWPTMLKDCFKYYKGCEACQKFGKAQSAPASMLHPIVKPWPLRGWGLDFIGEIHPSSTKGHRFVLMATDYFTKWVEVVPLKNMTHREVISFVLEHIVHRFGKPQTLMTDQGASFMSHQFREFAASLRIKLLNSSPYYTQANGQAEASNKILIGLIKKKIEEKPRRWHEVLSEALWAYRVLKHGAIKVTPFELVCGQEAVLPVELNVHADRVLHQDTVSAEDYKNMMMDEIDDLMENHLKALREIEKEKLQIANAYNKKVREKSFQVEDMVWKMILPVGSRGLVNGLQVGRVLTELLGSSQGMLTSWKR
jgi:transposase InsO family protein